MCFPVHEGVFRFRTVTWRAVYFPPTHSSTLALSLLSPSLLPLSVSLSVSLSLACSHSLSSHTSLKEGHSFFSRRRLAHLCLHFSPYTPITIATPFLILSNCVGVLQSSLLFVMCKNKTFWLAMSCSGYAIEEIHKILAKRVSP